MAVGASLSMPDAVDACVRAEMRRSVNVKARATSAALLKCAMGRVITANTSFVEDAQLLIVLHKNRLISGECDSIA
jgi:hypothetical protein